MKKGIVAARTQIAIEKIAEKTGIDVSKGNFPKTRDPFAVRMFQLEILAENLPEMQDGFEEALKQEILDEIKEIKGVGEALFGRIEQVVLE